ncbi:MAG: hypothetical protein OEZ01_05395, partial [Candidatus Heimdallarchaeota archaeon]|nr:hypothetical protein [Candidatus Heimdallarchaeota archaeon]
TEGNLIIAADGSWLELQKRGDKSPYFLENKRLNVEALMSGTQRVFFDLANAIQYETALSITPEEIELSQKILLSIAYSSLKDGRRIDISKTPEKFTVTGKFGDKYA